jgi:hypothetical protein
MNLPFPAGSANYGRRNRWEACNIHHLKGFGIFVRHNRGEIDAGRDFRQPILCVLEMLAPLFCQ